MANDLNQCNFIGRLGRDPEVRYTPDGAAVANFSIAVGESWKDKASGEKQEKTEWVKCVAWRKLGEIIGEYLSKGSQVFISGKLQTRSWEKDGVTKYTSEIIVNQMQMLGSGATQEPKQEEAKVKEPVTTNNSSVDDDSDIPF